jgi:hypothetical protein
LVEPPGSGEGGRSTGETVGDFVERAVAPEAHDHVDTVVGGPLREAAGVPSSVGFGHGDLMIRRERLLDDDPSARRDR